MASPWLWSGCNRFGGAFGVGRAARGGRGAWATPTEGSEADAAGGAYGRLARHQPARTTSGPNIASSQATASTL